MQASDLLEIALRKGFTRDQAAAALRSLDEAQVTRLAWACRWAQTRHEHQIVPEDIDGVPWSVWLILGGRGAGKTRVGAEWIGMAAATTGRDRNGKSFRGLVAAPTSNDLRNTCFEGEAGILEVIPSSLIKSYNISNHQTRLHNGSLIGGISAEKSTRFRGPQWHRAWCLLGSSMVYMGDGSTKRLDEVRAGDYVMTRQGERMVEWAGMTNAAAEIAEVSTQHGSSIHGTMEHPIWTKEEGFICLSDLTPRHHVMCLRTAGAGSSEQTATITDATESGHAQKTTRSPSISTLRCMSGRLVQSLKASLFTIGTKKKATTSRLISKLCRGLSTTVFIRLVELMASTKKKPYAVQPRSNGLPLHTSSASASIVVQCFNQEQEESHASPVASSAWSAVATATLSGVQRVRKLPGRHAVYNLKVRGQPEFFANGILVHNCDELAAWGDNGRDPQDAWDTMALSVRLGNDTRILATTTPRPLPHIKSLLVDPGTVVTTASTYVNLANLSPEFAKRILKYEGTKIGRQEIHAEVIDSEEGGIVNRTQLRKWPASNPFPEFQYIVYSLDTAFSEESYDVKSRETDPSAMSCWGGFIHKGKPGIMLLDCWAEKLGFPQLVDRVIEEKGIKYGKQDAPLIPLPMVNGRRQKPTRQGKKIDLIVIEGKASGKSLRQQLAKERIMTYEYNPGKASKLTRLHVVSHLPSHGIIWIPESPKNPGKFMTWAEPLIEQLCSYSGEGTTLHDDLLDTTTQAWRVIEDQWLREAQARLDKTRLSPNQREDSEPRPTRPAGNPYG